MRAWRSAALGSFVERIDTWNPATDAPAESFTYIDISAIDQDSKRIVNPQVIMGLEAPSRARQCVRAGDVLVSTVRPNLNSVARVPEALDGATASTGFCVLRVRQDLMDGGYLFHWVKSRSFITDMVMKATGASYPAVTDRIVHESQLPVPPLPDQRRIAEVLDRAEHLRAKRQEMLSRLDELVMSVFVSMFGDAAANPHRWPVVSLGDLISDGPQNGLYKPASHYGSGTPILRIDAFYDGAVNDLASLKRVTVSDTEREQYSLHEGDVVINRVNSIDYLGKCALIPKLNEPTVYESNMMRFRTLTDRVHPGYLVQFLQTKFIRAQILQKAKRAVNQASINQQDVRGFQICLPPIDLQQEFARRVAAIENLKAAQRASLTELDALFASLQRRAFRGEL